MLKRLFSIISISLVITASFFSAYNINYPVYADSDIDNWMNVTTNEQMVEAFKYYCKSRDLTIEGSVADAVTSFTTKTFNGIINTLGIDVTAIQAHLKYQTDSNTGLRFLFDTVGVSLYNSIFEQFLMDNELEVGDEDIDKLVVSGEWFTDDNGYGCYVWYVNSTTSGSSSTPTKKGSFLKYQPDDFYSYPLGLTLSITINGNTYSGVTEGQTTGVWPYVRLRASNPQYNSSVTRILYQKNTDDKKVYYTGATTILKYNGNYYLGTMSEKPQNVPYYEWCGWWLLNNATTQNGDVYINSTVINNNVYEGDTIINNNGDVINNNYPDNPDIPDPNPDPTPDPPTIPDSGGWQDFSLPDMPNDWLIYGMERKFPFDIPFNILFALSLLNHEPEIPKFEGDIDLQVCTWHYDIDLTPFDDIATILRKFEVLGFIIGLAILTKNLINWG